MDGQERKRRRVLLAAIGNGRFFGGGMKICPDARLDDGMLDLVTVGDLVARRGGGQPRQNSTTARTWSWRTCTARASLTSVAEPVDPDAIIPVELDGETPGFLPATFEILPGALRLRA